VAANNEINTTIYIFIAIFLKNGILSALPYAVFWLIIIVSGIVGDKLQNLNMSKKTVLNIFNSIGKI